MIDGHCLMPFGQDFTIANVNKTWIKGIFSYVSISAKFCGAFFTNTFGIFWQHLNHPNLLVCSVYQLHVYFHVKIMLHRFGIASLHEDGWSLIKLILQGHIIVFVMIMLLIQMKCGWKNIGFIRKHTVYIWTYIYLFLTSQVQARLSIVGNLASNIDAQQIFNSTFNAKINDSVDIGSC